MARRKKPIDENGVPYEQPFPGYEVNLLLREDRKTKTWRGWNLLFDKEVIIKDLEPVFGDKREEGIEEFFDEARSVARLRHDGIVRALDTGRSGSRFYFVQDFIKGPTLAERLERRNEPMEEEAVLKMAGELLSSLDYLYELGMVHSNLKPGNIIFNEEDHALITDLGVPVNFLYRTPEGRAASEPSYCAPEQLEEGEYLDSRTDLYSLGLCLYEALTGRLPFSADNSLEMIRCHLEEEPIKLRQVAPTLSAATQSLIMSLICRERSERPDDPAMALEMLKSHPLMQDKFSSEEGVEEEECGNEVEVDEGCQEDLEI